MLSHVPWGSFSSLQVKIGEPKTLAIILHGYGANAADLYPIHRAISFSENTHWVFLEAPMDLDGMGSKAWFPIDMLELQRAIERGGFRDFSQNAPEGFTEVADLLTEEIGKLSKSYTRLIVGGFSQGAMLAVEVALRLSRVKLAMIFSGNLVHRTRLEHFARQRGEPLLFFQSHGKFDPILSIESAKELYELLKNSGHEGEFLSFDGAHEIPPLVFTQMDKFISEKL